MGTVEYTARDYQGIWDLLLNVPNLSIVCLGFERGVDLRDEQLQVGTFPWDQSPLVIGAVRDSESDSNAWIVRQGPEMRWLKARARAEEADSSAAC